MPTARPTPPPLPRSSVLAAVHGAIEDLPPIYRDLIKRLARETTPANTRRALESYLSNLWIGAMQ